MSWTKEQHEFQMKPHVIKLMGSLGNAGIFCTDDGVGNLVFYSAAKNKVAVISKHSFFGYSRIACVYKHHDDHHIEAIDVTDSMYMENFMKPIIEQLLK